MTSNCFDHKKANMLVLSNRPVLLRPSRMIYWSNVILLTLIDNIKYYPFHQPSTTKNYSLINRIYTP